jgi:MFS transporter, AAHS family, 4-hydroxybenzoate transporter
MGVGGQGAFRFDLGPGAADNGKNKKTVARPPTGGRTHKGEYAMAVAQTVDVARIIDDRKMDGFMWSLLIWSFLIIIFDGYDIAAISASAPLVIKAWGVTNPGVFMGTVISASLFGMLFGAPVLGYLGDTFGRKPATVLSSLVFGGFTLACCWATDLETLRILRFLAGLGIGGMMPNLIALNAEFAPKRIRATLVIIMFCGVTAGGAFPGFAAVYLAPTYGWQVIYFIGGVLPILMAVLALFFLPESLKYLVVRNKRARAVKLVKRLAPTLTVGSDSQFVVADERKVSGISPVQLFRGGLAFITPLLWLCFCMNLMGFYFMVAWMPTILRNTQVLTPDDAQFATVLIQIGGTVGGLLLARPMDKKGFAPVTVLFALAIPAIAAIGYFSDQSKTLVLVASFVAGFAVLGLQFGINAASGMIYPTAVRANGSGWAFGIGRFGSILGPILGGYYVAQHLPLNQLFLLWTIPSCIGFISALALTLLYKSRFKGLGLGQREVLDAAE